MAKNYFEHGKFEHGKEYLFTDREGGSGVKTHILKYNITANRFERGDVFEKLPAIFEPAFLRFQDCKGIVKLDVELAIHLADVGLLTIDPKTKRYYYTCPYQALYMQEYFDVELQKVEMLGDEVNVFGAYDEGGYQKIKIIPHFNKVYVSQESEHIFEPKASQSIPKRNCLIAIERFTQEDGGLDSEGNLCMFFGKNWILQNQLADERGYDVVGDVKIILRDGKQFFMPEVEND